MKRQQQKRRVDKVRERVGGRAGDVSHRRPETDSLILLTSEGVGGRATEALINNAATVEC